MSIRHRSSPFPSPNRRNTESFWMKWFVQYDVFMSSAKKKSQLILTMRHTGDRNRQNIHHGKSIGKLINKGKWIKPFVKQFCVGLIGEQNHFLLIIRIELTHLQSSTMCSEPNCQKLHYSEYLHVSIHIINSESKICVTLMSLNVQQHPQKKRTKWKTVQIKTKARKFSLTQWTNTLTSEALQMKLN